MISAIMFFLFGYAIMFGTAENIAFSSIGTINDYAFALMQLMYATICITIFGGAMSERTRTNALLAGAAISSVLIYPVFGRWVWNSEGWLNTLGFMDFAGGSVVHLSGGLIALVFVVLIGVNFFVEFALNIVVCPAISKALFAVKRARRG